MPCFRRVFSSTKYHL